MAPDRRDNGLENFLPDPS